MTGQPLDIFPLWVLYPLTLLVLLAAMEAGYRLNKAIQRRLPDKAAAIVSDVVAAALALLAFLLAFVVGFASDIFNERRRLVNAEANAILTAYLRAGYLEAPCGMESRDLLREYTDLRLAAPEPALRDVASARSEQIQDELWARAEVVAVKSPFPTTALYIDSLNEVIDRYAERLTIGLEGRVLPIILLGLYVVALLTMFLVGVQNSYEEKRNVLVLVILVLILSVVLYVIADLDRAHEGLLQAPQQPFIDLQHRLGTSP